MKDTINMSVSQVFARNGERYAFVSFTDGEKNAEGKIPECRIIFRKRFQQRRNKAAGGLHEKGACPS